VPFFPEKIALNIIIRKLASLISVIPISICPPQRNAVFYYDCGSTCFALNDSIPIFESLIKVIQEVINKSLVFA